MKSSLKRQRLLLRRLRRFVLTTVLGGLVVVLPIGLLWFLMRALFRWITDLLAPVEELFFFLPRINALLIDLLSIVVILAAFFFIGLFVRTRLGQRLFALLENSFLAPLPFYKVIRDTVQQFLGQQKMPFREVVMVDAFGSPTRMLGFVTSRQSDYITVFVPTGPNPTNGFIFHLKEEQVESLPVKPEEAMRTIIGVGTGSEVLFESPKQTQGN